MSSTYCQHNHLTFSARAAMCLGPALSTREEQAALGNADSKGAPGMRWTGDLAPAYVLTTLCQWGILACAFPSNTSRELHVSSFLSFPCKFTHGNRRDMSSPGTQPGHALCKSSWPPLKAKGTCPRTAGGNWKCRRAAGAAQLCCGFCQQ